VYCSGRDDNIEQRPEKLARIELSDSNSTVAMATRDSAGTSTVGMTARDSHSAFVEYSASVKVESSFVADSLSADGCKYSDSELIVCDKSPRKSVAVDHHSEMVQGRQERHSKTVPGRQERRSEMVPHQSETIPSGPESRTETIRQEPAATISAKQKQTILVTPGSTVKPSMPVDVVTVSCDIAVDDSPVHETIAAALETIGKELGSTDNKNSNLSTHVNIITSH